MICLYDPLLNNILQKVSQNEPSGLLDRMTASLRQGFG